MTVEEMKRILALLALLALAGCGANPAGGLGGGGAVSIKVSSAASFNTNIRPGRIDKYRVTVSGEGIDPAIVTDFAADMEEGIISGIPTGDDRTVAVEAINPNGVSIREGETFEVKVGGGITEVPVTLEAVPIFTNIADGNTIDNTRLVFKIFSDPGNPVTVKEYSDGVQRLLVDASTNLTEVLLDQSTGLGRFVPKLMEPGRRTFAVEDMVTGRSHEVGVQVVDGTNRRPAPLVSATSADERFYTCSAPWCAP